MKNKFSIAMSLAVILAMVFTALAFAQSAGPSISSEFADYGPSEYVNLSGAGWQAGEAVHIFVNDNAGQTWSYSGDVVAATDGTITDSFQLPDWFVAIYNVTATGATSGTATTTFTDGNLKFHETGLPATTSWSVTWNSNLNTNTAPNDVTFGGSGGIAGYTVTSPLSGGTGVQFVASPASGTATQPSSGTTIVNISFTTQYQVSFAVSPSAGGTVSPSATTFYNATSVVPVSATANTGYTFSSWSSNTGSITFANASSASTNATINGTGTITANFVLSDSTPPVITFTGTAPNANGWNNSDVAISWSVSDPESSFTSSGCDTTTATAETSGTTFTCSATSAGGTSSKSVIVKIDKTNPVITGSRLPVANANGWNNTDVVVSFSCTDSGGSTIDTNTVAGATLSTEGAGQSVTNSGTCTDKAGNVANSATVSGINIDKTKPVITGSRLPLANANGWNNTDVVVSFSCTDSGGSTIDTNTVAGATLSTEGAGQSVTNSGTCTDKAGNVANSATVSGINIDKTAPTITGSASPVANSFGWNNTDVTVSFTCGDALSTVDTCSASSTLGEGANQSVTGTVTDKAGNTASATVSGINVDKTAPTISGAATTSPNINGWYKNDVTIHWTCSDASSGLNGSCPADSTITGEGNNLSASASVSDLAGNSASATVSGIKIDRTAPTISGATDRAPNGAGWYNADVTVSFTCDDALSGVDTCSGPTTLGEGANQSVPGTVTDKAGNTASATVNGINIDKTAPSASASASPAANANGWNNTNVTVSFSGNDGTGSGIDFCATPVVLSSEGAGQSASGTCTDKAGNVSAAATANNINIDKTAPSASASASPAANANGWNNTNVTVSFSGNDGTGSGIDFCATPVVLSSEGAGQSASGTCTDKAGNVSAAATANNINIDKTAPTVSLVGGPANGVTYYFGFVPAAPTCSANDVLSGIDGTCSVSGYSTAIGSHTVTASATDKAGNSASSSIVYTVSSWTLKGFYQPVDMNGVLNTVKGGSTVPLKFEVFAGPTELTDTAIVSSLLKEVTCNATTEDTIDVLATGGTSLRYDTTSGQFIFNWQTPKLPGHCYSVTLKTQDGSSITALFKLK